MFKKLLIVLISTVFLVCQAHASVWVWTNTSNEVLFIDEKDSVVISPSDQANIEKTILPKDIEFYGLTEAYTDYKLINNKFILNTAKISDRENRKNQEAVDAQAKRDAFVSAKAKLKSITWTPLTDDEVEALK